MLLDCLANTCSCQLWEQQYHDVKQKIVNTPKQELTTHITHTHTHQTLNSVLQASPTTHTLEQHFDLTWPDLMSGCCQNSQPKKTLILHIPILTCQDMYSQVLMWHPFFLECLQHVGPMMRPVCNRAMSMLCLGKRLVVRGHGPWGWENNRTTPRWKAENVPLLRKMDVIFFVKQIRL